MGQDSFYDQRCGLRQVALSSCKPHFRHSTGCEWGQQRECSDCFSFGQVTPTFVDAVVFRTLAATFNLLISGTRL